MDGNSLGTAAIVAVFLVPIVSLIKRPTWRLEAKHLLGLGAALVAAIVGALVDGHVNTLQEFIPLVGTAFMTSQSLYALYFNDTKLNEKLENV